VRRLDPAQSAAAKGQASIQLTLAGPGSGKTSTLTGRFVYLIRQGVDPARILAVTFTKKAADEMRRRIARLLELPSPSGLHVMTFHAFAFRLLKKNPGMAGLSEGFRLWDVPEQRHVFSSRRMWWNEETDILDIIGGAKERLLDADGFAASIDRDDDALVVLVDEYQDVNPGQVGLIDHFVNDGVRLWAVGDDHQTLYAFRASDVRYILEFTKKFPAAAIHALDRNYRSCPDIVLAAKRLIRHDHRRS
jgi:DNA helicase-2/ATP-dependent DNA helicase PcrA